MQVKIVGVGTEDEVVIAGDKLNNREALLEIGNKASKPGAVKDVVATLSEKLFRLGCVLV